MADYNVQITDGVGSQDMKKGTYAVTVSANGYEATTLNPTTFTATENVGGENFTLSANGVLTLIFNDTGAIGGAPITEGSVVMTNETGDTEYGEPITINAGGEAVFNNVPYNHATAYVLYFKQLATDASHNIYEGVITVNMNSAAQTEYVLNAPIAAQNFTLTDANYSGLPIAEATLTFTAE